MPTVVFTAHAEEMLSARGLDKDWALRILERPDFDEPDPVHPLRRRAFGSVPERDGRIMRIVYERSDETIIIVTAFLDRGRQR